MEKEAKKQQIDNKEGRSSPHFETAKPKGEEQEDEKAEMTMAELREARLNALKNQKQS